MSTGIGMMWFDNKPKTTLADKIKEAADYYKKKYGAWPDACQVSQAASAQVPASGFFEYESGKINVRALHSILPYHLWIGVAEKEQAKE